MFSTFETGRLICDYTVSKQALCNQALKSLIFQIFVEKNCTSFSNLQILNSLGRNVVLFAALGYDKNHLVGTSVSNNNFVI